MCGGREGVSKSEGGREGGRESVRRVNEGERAGLSKTRGVQVRTCLKYFCLKICPLLSSFFATAMPYICEQEREHTLLTNHYSIVCLPHNSHNAP